MQEGIAATSALERRPRAWEILYICTFSSCFRVCCSPPFTEPEFVACVAVDICAADQECDHHEWL